MASGSPRRSRYNRGLYKERIAKGWKQVNLWLPPDLAGPLGEIATEEKQPFSVVIEKILRESLRRPEPFKLIFNEPKIPEIPEDLTEFYQKLRDAGWCEEVKHD